MKKASAVGFAFVRKATGLSQQKFAAAIGVSKATVENIELGRAPISDDLAAAVGAYVGAVPWTISSKEGPRDFAGGKYSAQSWKHWQEYQFDDAQIKELMEMARDALVVLLEAAARNSAGGYSSHIFRTVLLELNKFIFTQMETRHLESRISTVMQDNFSTTQEGETTVGEIRAELERTPQWQANEKSQWKASAKARYKRQIIPLFVPFVGFMKLDSGTPVFLNARHEMRCIYDLDIDGHKFRVVKNNAKMQAMLSSDSMSVLKPRSSRQQKHKV